MREPIGGRRRGRRRTLPPMADEDDDWGDNAAPTIMGSSFDAMLGEEAADLEGADLEGADLEGAELVGPAPQGVALDAGADPFDGAPTRVASFEEPIDGRLTEPDPPPPAPEPAPAYVESQFVAEQRELPSYLTQRSAPSPVAPPSAPARSRPSPVLLFLMSAGVVFFAGACLLGIAFALLR